jgi:hypothetical protein
LSELIRQRWTSESKEIRVTKAPLAPPVRGAATEVEVALDNVRAVDDVRAGILVLR